MTLSATVRDTETPIDQLTFDWKADAGTFTGTGASVRWRAPRDTQTPANYAINLTVTERYGIPTASGPQPQHVVSAATPPQIRVHDSPREIGDMALRFLRSFANSAVSSDAALQEFSDSCGGKKAEKEDIDDNRRDFEILSSQLTLSSSRVTSAFSRGEVTVRCSFSSRRKFCPADAPRGCRVGAIENVDGTCRLTSVYEQQRWFLCDSNFFGTLAPTMKGFFGRDR